MQEIKKIEIKKLAEPSISYITTYKIGDKEFKSLWQAKKHQRYLLYKELFKDIPHTTSRLNDYNYDEQDWFYCKTLNHLLAVISSKGIDNFDEKDAEDIKFPQWLMVQYVDGGDHLSEAFIYSFEDYKRDILLATEFINSIENYFEDKIILGEPDYIGTVNKI